ncbi:MAG: hypothetical protein E2604_16710 [Flavobacterium sp.]|nr:hypothetical protein [Flavobacterium sp.]
MREVEKKDIAKETVVQKDNKALSYEEQKKQKALQNKLSKIESQVQELEKEIRKDDKALAEHYEKLMQDASFFTAYEKKKKELEQLLEEWENVQAEIESNS